MMGQFFTFVILVITAIGIKSDSCTSSDCTTFANLMKNSMNSTADPCGDFNEYACGRWEINNPIPKDEISWDVYKIFIENVKKQLINILNGSVSLVNPSGAFHKLRKMYQNCMNVAALEFNGAKTILSQLWKSGEWPMIMPADDWKPDVTSLHKMHEGYTKKTGLPLFYKIRVYPTEVNSSFNFLYVDALGRASITPVLLGNLRNSSRISKYVGYITEIVKILVSEGNSTITMKDLKNDVDDLVDFQIAMNEILYASWIEYQPMSEENSMTINDYQDWYNNQSCSDNSRMKWIDFLQSVFQGTGIHLKGDDIVVIPAKSYITSVVKLLDATPLRTIVNYVQWNFVEGMLQFSPEKLRDIGDKLLELNGFSRIKGNRNELCLVTSSLEHALSYEYVKLYFPKKKKEFIHDFTAAASQTAYKIFNETLWVTPEEKKILRDKLLATQYSIGYPDWYDNSAIDDYYEECMINEDFMENIIEVRRFNWNLSLKKFGQPIDKNRFAADPLEIIAAYSSASNALVFTAGWAQNPQFSEYIPRALRYATFGSVIGHELAHTYEDIGAKFDKNGLSDLWSNTTKDRFASKAQCFIEQYKQYKIYETKSTTLYVRGYHTMHENIADLYGLKIAYKAYEDGATFEDHKLKLPGLESHNDKQLFFLAYANLWCSATKPSFQNYIKVSYDDNHSPSKFRIIGVLSNMKEFSDAFNCSINSPMNPSKKCTIWGQNN